MVQEVNVELGHRMKGKKETSSQENRKKEEATESQNDDDLYFHFVLPQTKTNETCTSSRKETFRRIIPGNYVSGCKKLCETFAM